MKSFVFPYYISFGKLDSISCEIELNISDKDAKRLEKSAKEGGRLRLNEDEDISDLYDKVYRKIIQFEKEALSLDPSPVRDFLSWEENFDEDLPITDEQVDYYLDHLTIGVNYPEEFQLLERTKARKKKQTTCDSITIDRSEAQEFVYTKNNKDKIVFIDDGETLYFVPLKYTGTFTIPSTVKRLEGDLIFNPFSKHKQTMDTKVGMPIPFYSITKAIRTSLPSIILMILGEVLLHLRFMMSIQIHFLSSKKSYEKTIICPILWYFRERMGKYI